MSSIDFDTHFWRNKTPLIDSRKVIFPAKSIFFAIKGAKVDGHQFIDELYQKGVRHFVVNQVDEAQYKEAYFVLTKDVVGVLQQFATHHRLLFNLPIIGITGSNGKTIIKEWLFQLLQTQYAIIKSPKSYNSQIGVPLSVLGIHQRHTLAIFEAGISTTDEMHKLQAIIRPTIGIMTNIGKAHAKGFEGQTQKIKEKIRLFEGAKKIIYCYNHQKIHEQLSQAYDKTQLVSWGASEAATIPIFIQKRAHKKTVVRIDYQGKQAIVSLPFGNEASVENGLHCIVTLLVLGQSLDDILPKLQELRNIPMRLEMKEGINQCHIIDDSYNNDIEGLKIALDFLQQKHKNSPAFRKTLILSDVLESNQDNLYVNIAQLLRQHQIQKFIGIGPQLLKHQWLFDEVEERHFYENTEDFVPKIDTTIPFRQESILLKGARTFEFERIAQRLKKRIHSTVLEINLSAIANNLHIYRNLLQSSTKLMVMVKASAYGSGSFEVAQLLQYNHVDYLGVAYVDEGIALRQKGIELPIMVMNTALHEYELSAQYNLEPVIYSLEGLTSYQQFCRNAAKPPPPIHLEWDTGLHRLGFVYSDLARVIDSFANNSSSIKIASIFSHLAAADEEAQTAFSEQQIRSFDSICTQLKEALDITPLCHILNSAGISRFNDHQFDMVRLGIGLYGVDPTQQLPQLQAVACLKTTISQIKSISPQDSVGYSRQGRLQQKGKIAVIAIGYADGFARAFGNGKAKVKIHNQWAPTVGNICMDMCFVDVSHIPQASVGDEVIVFDTLQTIMQLASSLKSIPYEVLTNINDRVPRIFYEE